MLFELRIFADPDMRGEGMKNLALLGTLISVAAVPASAETCKKFAEKNAHKLALAQSPAAEVVSSREIYASTIEHTAADKEVWIVETRSEGRTSSYLVVAKLLQHPISGRNIGCFFEYADTANRN